MTRTESLLEKQLLDDTTAEKAFSILVGMYQQRVYFTIRRLLIDHEDTNDCVQKTFIQAWKKRSQFKGQASYFTWLYRIATNEALQFLRKKKSEGWQRVDYEKALMNKVSNRELSANEVEIKLEKALLQLPDKQRLVFQLKYFDDLKYEEIQAITSTSIGALKSSYHLAVKKIEDYINRND